MSIKNRADLGKRKEYKLFEPEFVTTQPGFNVRQDTPQVREHIDWLTDSIIDVGIKVPLQGRWDSELGKVVIYDGHCRYQAALQAKEKGYDIKIPVILQDKYGNEGDRLAAMLIANSGLELTALEKAEVCKRLHNYGWTIDQIAKAHKPKLSHQQVYNLLELSTASPEVQQLITDGSIAPTTAIDTIREHGSDKATKVLREAFEEVKAQGKSKVTNSAIRKSAPLPSKSSKSNNRSLNTATNPYAAEMQDIGIINVQPNEPLNVATPAKDPLERISESLERYKQQNRPEDTLRQLLTDLAGSKVTYMDGSKVRVEIDLQTWENLQKIV